MCPPIPLSSRLDGISESATLKLNATVQALIARGENVVNLTAGEPDSPVPPAGKEAMCQAVAADKSKYTPVAGIPELRQAIADKTNRQHPSLKGAGLAPWAKEEVVVTNGGKQALFNIFMALLNAGDEVLIPAPYWLSYPEMARIAGGVPRFLPTTQETGFKLTPGQLEEALKSSGGRARILVLNSPSNPTGAAYTQAEYRALGEVLLRAPGGASPWVVSDEIYDLITFDGQPFCSFLEAEPRLRDRVITVNGMSKSAAMTGWRVGWAVGRRELIQALITLQGQSTSNVCAPAQWASVAVLKSPESEFVPQRERYQRRRDLCLEILRKSGKMDLFTPQGAFYLFVGVKPLLAGGEDSMGFAQRLLEQAKVAVVPGTPFGAPHHLRLSFACDDAVLGEGCERIVKFAR